MSAEVLNCNSAMSRDTKIYGFFSFKWTRRNESAETHFIKKQSLTKPFKKAYFLVSISLYRQGIWG